MVAHHQNGVPTTGGNTHSPAQRQVFKPSGSGMRGSSTPLASPGTRPHCNEERGADSHGRSSHLSGRHGEKNRDRGHEDRHHAQYGERSPNYTQKGSPRVREQGRRSPTPINANVREVVHSIF